MFSDNDVDLIKKMLIDKGYLIKLPAIFFEKHLTFYRPNEDNNMIIVSCQVENIEMGFYIIFHSKIKSSKQKKYSSGFELVDQSKMITSDKKDEIFELSTNLFIEEALTYYVKKYSLYYNVLDF